MYGRCSIIDCPARKNGSGTVYNCKPEFPQPLTLWGQFTIGINSVKGIIRLVFKPVANALNLIFSTTQCIRSLLLLFAPQFRPGLFQASKTVKTVK